MKPGWARVNFHFLMSDAEFDFLCEAIRFVAEQGKYFLPLYDFELATGTWRHRGFPLPEPQFGLAEALAPGLPSAADDATPASGVPEQELYRAYLQEARRLAQELKEGFNEAELDTTERDLIPFVFCRR